MACPSTPIGVEGLPTNDLSYCPTDRTVRWREVAMRRIYDDLGDFAIATLFGVIWAEVHNTPASGTDPVEPAIRTNRALCSTGVWARAEYDRSDPRPTASGTDGRDGRDGDDDATPPLSPGDLDEAVQQATQAFATASPSVG